MPGGRWPVPPVLVTTTSPVVAQPRTPHTYYVDPAGSDSHDGLSPATAWATVAQAMTVGLVDGDTLSLKGGATHAGNITLNAIPTTLGITINSYGGGQATLVPDDTTVNGIMIENQSNVLLDNLKLQGSGVTLSGSFPTMTSTTPGVGSAIILYALTDTTQYENITIQNCTVDGFLRGIVAYAGNSTCTVAYRNVTIQDCVVQNCGVWGISSHGAPYTGSTGPRIYDHWHIQRCSVTTIFGLSTAGYVGFGFLMFGNTNTLIEKCYVASISIASLNNEVNGAAGIECAFSDGTLVRECEVHDIYAPSQIDGCAIDADLDCTNIVFERCYVYGCHGEGIISFGNAAGTVFRACVIQSNGLYMNAGSSRGSNARFDQPTSVLHCSFYLDGAITARLPGLFETFTTGGSIFVNNIFAVSGGATIGSLHGVVLIGNCYTGPSGSWRVNLDGNDYSSLAALHAAGFETHASVGYGLDGDPQLSNPSVVSTQWPTTGTPATLTNFDLAHPGSPALNTALNAATLLGLTNVGTLDFHGHPLNSGSGATGFSFGATQIAPVPSFIPAWAQGSNRVLQGMGA